MTDQLSHLARLRAKSLTARGEYEAAIIAAHEAKVPLRQIAEAAGISHQRVHQIIQKGQS